MSSTTSGAGPDGGARPRLSGRFTVQGWFLLVLGLMALVVVVSAVVGGVMVNRAEERQDELADVIQPGRSVSLRLQKSLLDQETSVRGYALSGRDEFLEPYRQGQRDQRERTAQLRELVSVYPKLMSDLREVERAAATWRTEQAEPLIANVREEGGAGVTPDRIERSKQGFDDLRAVFALQETHFDEERTRARAEAADARTQRNLAFGVLLAAIVAACALLTVIVHRIVGRPLRRLEAASQRVRDESFEQEIRIEGPADLRAVGTAVEEMRRRLVDALREAKGRERLLEEQTEELRRSNAELEQFAYVASHDLQEPLRKVASFCQLLEKRYGTELDDRGRQYIDFAVDGAKRMQVLINDLLTFSRVGRLDEEYTTVGLDAPLERALNSLSVAVEESGAEIVRPERLPTLTCDPTLMTMVWQNLVGNALKFRHPDRPCRVEIACERAGDDWAFTVRDNGIGIPAEFAEKVFVVFQRLHGRDEYGGTGIGLALCRKIVEHHRGSIAVHEPGEREGTEIRFTLPADAAEPADAWHTADAEEPAADENPAATVPAPAGEPAPNAPTTTRTTRSTV
ncbi:ATP-binding protein [Streptomyces sp. NPDC005805]|uniref:sensor histidine kinase n=1 Tax=Streptomyces sp. NPDC005805 TaxID=3157068 RepID=UPI0033C6307B